MRKRIAILIDGANFYTTAKRLGFAIDYKRLLEMYSDEIHRAMFFTGLPPKEVSSGLRKMVDWMGHHGYVCITKIVKEYRDDNGIPKIKANMDVEITVEAMKIAPKVDEVHLFTGDGDFTYLVKNIQDYGAKVVVYSSTHEDVDMASMSLRQQADMFIDVVTLRHQIEKGGAEVPLVRRNFWGKKDG